MFLRCSDPFPGALTPSVYWVLQAAAAAPSAGLITVMYLPLVYHQTGHHTNVSIVLDYIYGI